MSNAVMKAKRLDIYAFMGKNLYSFSKNAKTFSTPLPPRKRNWGKKQTFLAFLFLTLIPSSYSSSADKGKSTSVEAFPALVTWQRVSSDGLVRIPQCLSHIF